MDLWVVAAAAGAGYLAKYWKNIFQDNKSGLPSGSSIPFNPLSRSLIQERSDNICTAGNLSPRKTVDQYVSERSNENLTDDTFAETSRRGGPTTMDVPSTNVLHHRKQIEKHEDGNMPSSSGFQPEFGGYEKSEYESGYRLGSDLIDIPENNILGTGPSHSPRISRKSWRSKRLDLQFIKPRSSLDSCLAAQMHRGHAEMEDYLLNLSPLVSPCTPTLRPFLVTDGRRLIGRASSDFKAGLHNNKGFPSGQFLFCLGISIGMMYTIIAQNLEVEKLKESLEQSKNLVQDLQEELEMKDSLTVKELVIDDSSQDALESLLIDKDLSIFSSEVDANVSMKCANDESVSLKEVESMSKIEAELQAELERLGLSMNGTTLQGMLSGAIEPEHEFDEDVVAELVHGELKADLRGKSSSEPTPYRGLTPLPANHGVSPHELSLRLHEVIESRLQKRIMELEAELLRTQKRAQHLESEKVHSWREFWNSESSSNPSTPIVVEAHSPVTQPLVMNLSGDALDAYNEACEELSKIKGFQTEDARTNGHKDDQLVTHQVSNGNQDFDIKITRAEPMPTRRMRISTNEGSPNLDDGSPNCNEDSDDDDVDLLLIKQIVEKARQGSPAILRAKRALVHLER